MIRYLEEELEGEEVSILVVEEEREDAALAHLLKDNDAERGGAHRQHQQQRVMSPPPGASAARSPLPLSLPLHHLPLSLSTRCSPLNFALSLQGIGCPGRKQAGAFLLASVSEKRARLSRRIKMQMQMRSRIALVWEERRGQRGSLTMALN